MCHIRCRLGDGKGIARVRRDLCPVFGPVLESVTVIRCCNQCAGLTIVVTSCTSDGSSIFWVSHGGDDVVLRSEVGHEITVIGNGECVTWIGRDLLSVLGPVDEGEA